MGLEQRPNLVGLRLHLLFAISELSTFLKVLRLLPKSPLTKQDSRVKFNPICYDLNGLDTCTERASQTQFVAAFYFIHPFMDERAEKGLSFFACCQKMERLGKRRLDAKTARID